MPRVIPLLPSMPFVVLGTKWWVFPGWTWKGVFLTPEGVASVFGAIAIWSCGLWAISLIGESRSIRIGWKFALTFYCLIIGSLISFGEKEPFEKLLRVCADGNWTFARKEVESLKQFPFRPGLIQTATLYIDAHDMTARDTVNESTGVRELRSAVKQLLQGGENHRFLNTLSYAELSKYLYFKEGKSDPTIMEGIQLLRDTLRSLKNSSDKGPLLLKMGELLLAKQDYAGAIQSLNGAVATLETSPSKARALANWSTSYAALGEWQRAIDKYREAETLYPEGQREIFYSNLAYMLCQRATQLRGSGETAVAESCLREAEAFAKKALLIKNDDWIAVLNLALIQDELQKFAEAELNYKIVIGKAAKSEIVREAWFLYGRSLHLGKRPISEVVSALLQGLERASNDQIVNSYHTERTKTRELFAASAEALKQMPPHGLEPYIEWFLDTGNGL